MSIWAILLRTVVGGFTIGICVPLIWRKSTPPRYAFVTALLVALLCETIGGVSGAITVANGIDSRAWVLGTMVVSLVAGAGVIKSRHGLSMMDSACLLCAQFLLTLVVGFAIVLLVGVMT